MDFESSSVFQLMINQRQIQFQAEEWYEQKMYLAPVLTALYRLSRQPVNDAVGKTGCWLQCFKPVSHKQYKVKGEEADLQALEPDYLSSNCSSIIIYSRVLGLLSLSNLSFFRSETKMKTKMTWTEDKRWNEIKIKIEASSSDSHEDSVAMMVPGRRKCYIVAAVVTFPNVST